VCEELIVERSARRAEQESCGGRERDEKRDARLRQLVIGRHFLARLDARVRRRRRPGGRDGLLDLFDSDCFHEMPVERT
jgi:hypothetical protein